MSIHSKVRAKHEKFARHRADGGAIAKEVAKAKAKEAVSQHESHDHKGEPKTKLRLKRGGGVKGDKPVARLDKRARGGAMKHKKGHSTNIIINTGGAEMAKQAGMKQGMQVGAAMASHPPVPPPGAMPPTAPRPPMAPPPVAPPGMGAPPPRPIPNGPVPPMRARGGRMPKMTAGAGSGEGRLQKQDKPIPRKRGGKCD